MSHTTKQETPAAWRANGVSLEQGDLFGTGEFSPKLPKLNSKAYKALSDLVQQDVTQLDWLTWGRGWRLSAAIKELGYLGWRPIAIKVNHQGWSKPIARYSLSANAKSFARRALGGEA